MMRKYTVIRVSLAVLIALLILSVFLLPAHAEGDTEVVTEEDTVSSGSGDIQKTEWEIFFEKEILPKIVSAGTIFALLYISLAPLIISIKNTNAKIKVSTASFDSATESVKESQRRYEAARSESRENDEKIAGFEKRLRVLERKQDKTILMLKSGFCNMDEIVKKGYAEEIARAGEIREEDDSVKEETNEEKNETAD